MSEIILKSFKDFMKISKGLKNVFVTVKTNASVSLFNVLIFEDALTKLQNRTKVSEQPDETIRQNAATTQNLIKALSCWK